MKMNKRKKFKKKVLPRDLSSRRSKRRRLTTKIINVLPRVKRCSTNSEVDRVCTLFIIKTTTSSLYQNRTKIVVKIIILIGDLKFKVGL